MPNLIYEYQIPDPARPIPEEKRRSWSPSGELVPFVPAPLTVVDVAGRSIAAISTHVGTYGMGGPEFFGLRLDDIWLVIAVWGAGEWMHAGGRAILDKYYEDYGRARPWICDEFDELSDAIVGHTLGGVEIDKHFLRISIHDGPDLIIEESSNSRPVFEGTKEPRAFGAEDDLRRVVFIAPTDELWVS